MIDYKKSWNDPKNNWMFIAFIHDCKGVEQYPYILKDNPSSYRGLVTKEEAEKYFNEVRRYLKKDLDLVLSMKHTGDYKYMYKIPPYYKYKISMFRLLYNWIVELFNKKNVNKRKKNGRINS